MFNEMFNNPIHQDFINQIEEMIDEIKELAKKETDSHIKLKLLFAISSLKEARSTLEGIK